MPMIRNNHHLLFNKSLILQCKITIHWLLTTQVPFMRNKQLFYYLEVEIFVKCDADRDFFTIKYNYSIIYRFSNLILFVILLICNKIYVGAKKSLNSFNIILLFLKLIKYLNLTKIWDFSNLI